MSFCDDCFKGVTHEGTAEGKHETIGGVQCYVATPTVDYPKDKVILFLTDVFGLALINNLVRDGQSLIDKTYIVSQLLADDFARNGFKTIVPDLFNGDPVDKDALEPGAVFDFGKWRAAHGFDKTRPIVDGVIAALKSEGVAAIASTGYCYGARLVVDLACENDIQVSAITHPSALSMPDDMEKYAAVSKAPLLINSCTVDQAFPLEAQAKADEILGDGKFTPGYHREFIEGCKHGFAVRGDMSDPKVKAGKEGAFKSCVDWFKKYL